MEIFQASGTDLEDIVRLNECVQRIHAEREPTRFRVFDANAVREQIQQALDDSAVVFLIAVENGTALGYAMVRRCERQENAYGKARAYLELEHIAVSHDARRRGIGSALVEESFALAKSLSIPDLELSVWDFNEDAKRLFEKKGFKVCWQRMKSRGK
jgi:diamine N-acetyltransferase